MIGHTCSQSGCSGIRVHKALRRATKLIHIMFSDRAAGYHYESRSERTVRRSSPGTDTDRLRDYLLAKAVLDRSMANFEVTR